MGRKGSGSTNRQNPLAAAHSSPSGNEPPAKRDSGPVGDGRILPAEMAAIQEISRIVTSTLDIEQVYEKFAAEVKKLVDFDRVGISVIDFDADTFTPTYLSGVHWIGRAVGTIVPMAGTAIEQVKRTGLSIRREDIRTGECFSGDSGRLQAGLLSSLMVPLLSKGQPTGALHVNSRRAGAFGPREQAILERLADQIAPAVENARLYQELQASTEEKAVVDEVARIVTSTLNIDQVYEKFAAEVKKLVDFDRIGISVIDHDAGTFSPMYVSGVRVAGRELNAVVPLEGTLVERMLRKGTPILRDDIRSEVTSPVDRNRIRAGLRSSLMVALFCKGRITGNLHVFSLRAGAYGIKEQALLERLADQIAPAVENARLYQQLQASAEEKTVVGEVARIVTSTLDIDQVYERFAAEVKKLVDFDRLVITTANRDAAVFGNNYVSGVPFEEEAQTSTPIEGSVFERILQTSRSLIREDFSAGEGFWNDQARLRAGLRSSLAVPLRSKDRVTGVLHVLSRRVSAYGPKEQAILELLADQIAPSVENARLHESLQEAHDELESRVEARTAENAKLSEELRASTEEKAVIDEIARVITTTLDIHQVYEKFAAEVRRLVDFDRMSMNVINEESGAFSSAYQSGLVVEGREVGTAVPLEGTATERVLLTGRPLLCDDTATSDSFPGDALRLKAGVRSYLMVPLSSKGRTVGNMTVQSRQVGAYGPREQAILERLADQIAPAVENARLYEELQASTEEKAVIDEVARIVTSTLDVDQVYEKFSAEVKKLVSFDRVTVSVIEDEAGTFSPTYVAGLHMEGREVGKEVPLAGTASERMLQTGRSLLREDIRAGDSFVNDSAWTDIGLCSQILVPLKARDRVLGNLSLQSRQVGAYGPREQAILERLADQIAPAVENARLYDEVQQAHNELESRIEARTAELTRANMSLQESEERFRSVFQDSAVGMVLINRDGRYIQVNAAMSNILGYTEKELLSLSGRDVSYPADRGQVKSEMRRLWNGESDGFATEKRYLRKDGRIVWASVTVSPVRDAEGRTRYVVRQLQDITESKRAEQEIRQLALAVATATDAINIAGMDGKVVFANRALELMLGYEPGELQGMETISLHPEPIRDALAAEIFAAVANHGAWEGETVALRKCGDQVPIRLSVTLMRDGQGNPAGMIGIRTDITERKLLQEQLAQAQKMEVVGQLAGGVAHDFNNLLTPILGFSALGAEELTPDHPARRYFEQVQGAAERGADLVRRLLLFSRRQIAQPKAVNLNDVVLNTEKMLDRFIGEDIELACRLEPDLGKVKADPGQMEQILVNLAVNARDAMPGGGRLTIGTANVTLDPDTDSEFSQLVPGQYVKLSVSDTGTGMDDEVRAHLFEPFFTTKEPGKGTGLGLAICFGVVKEAEGHIRVQSEPGQGTTFEILLPRVEEAATEAARGSGSAGIPGGRETVLLVEDEPAVRSLAALALRRQGYAVLEAANGEEGLRVAQEYRPDGIDLLLTDVVMPHMGGSRLAELLRPQIPRLKVMFTSGFPDDTAVPGPASSPGTAFLPKPFTPTELTRRVREVLDASGPGA